MKLLCYIVLICSLALTTIARQGGGKNPSSYSFQFGNVTALVVTDGRILVSSNVFSARTEAVKRAFNENFREAFPFVMEMNILVLDTDIGRVMIDTGGLNSAEIGNKPFSFADAGKLMRNLRTAGVSPTSIDYILLTHAHADHVAGLASLDGTAAFPNAIVYINRVDHEFWSASPVPNPNPMVPQSVIDIVHSIYKRNVSPYQKADRLRLVEDNGSPLPGFRFIPAVGHSPGHAMIEFTTGKKRLILTGDVFATKADQVQNPEWDFGVDIDPLAAYESRIKFLEESASSGDLLLAYHENFPGLGRIRKWGRFFDWVPADIGNLGDVALSCREAEVEMVV